ncbi:MAG: electron transfer flavoprotein subunit alpha/FixB family protein [Firmicutes bacterium]|nr:electron transfer flavoprotein subunit alpha/FixB family protein [Bacillota bacterium]
MDYQGVWTIAEADSARIKTVSYELLSRGRKLADKLGCQLTSVLLCSEVTEEACEELLLRGADQVLLVQAEELEYFIVENYSNVLIDLINKYKPSIILSAATTMGRTLMPHVAIRVHAGLTADCTELDIEKETGNLLQTRPAIGGNILATIKTPDHRPQMATVRPRSARAAELDEKRRGQGQIIKVDYNQDLFDGRVERLGFRSNENEDVNIQDAEIVVVGGKGMKKKDNFCMLRELAAQLGGVVGASRDAVDRDWISYPHQIGLSGKTVTPKLYIGFGISGAIQHLAGMKTAETIIAVNEDPAADIFKVADFGIVGDLFEVLPALNEAIAREVR